MIDQVGSHVAIPGRVVKGLPDQGDAAHQRVRVFSAGPLEGERLRKLPTFTAFWFAWSAFNVDSEIHVPGTSE